MDLFQNLLNKTRQNYLETNKKFNSVLPENNIPQFVFENNRNQNMLHAFSPSSPSAYYFDPSGSHFDSSNNEPGYIPFKKELSDDEKTFRQLEEYEKVPGFSVPSMQQGVVYPDYPNWKGPQWTPNYEYQRFHDLINPAFSFPIT